MTQKNKSQLTMVSFFWKKGCSFFILFCAFAFLSSCSAFKKTHERSTPQKKLSENLLKKKPIRDEAMDETLGSGPVAVGLLLPLSSPSLGEVAREMRNAAEMALEEMGDQELKIFVRDEAGTKEGAEAATLSLASSRVEAVAGPLLASSVQAARLKARSVPGGDFPFVAFSTDERVASQGAYLLSFSPRSEVKRIIEYSLASKRKSFAAVVPNTVYGRLVERHFSQYVIQGGGRIASILRYDPKNVKELQEKLKPLLERPIDALFLPTETGGLTRLAMVMKNLKFWKKKTNKIQILGTSAWLSEQGARAKLPGALFAAPEMEKFADFSERYQSRYGKPPPRIATLAYDAVSLMVALVRVQKEQGVMQNYFSRNLLTNRSGFNGQDGVFRFTSEGFNERGLSVYALTAEGVKRVSESPARFKEAQRSF